MSFKYHDDIIFHHGMHHIRDTCIKVLDKTELIFLANPCYIDMMQKRIKKLLENKDIRVHIPKEQI
tara:strand:- start:783 stop:980 length:198 start_codon:yes stop_codon:yes gene_type:complete